MTDIDWGPFQVVDADGAITAPVDVPAACREAYQKIKPHHVDELDNAVRLCWTNLTGLDTTAQYEVVAIDKAGEQQKPYGTTAWNSGKDVFTADIFNIPKSDIVRFEYRLRPYRHWIRFAPLAIAAGKQVPTQFRVTTVAVTPGKEGAAALQTDDAGRLNAILDEFDQTFRSIRNLSVTSDYVKRQLFGLPVDKPVEMTLVTSVALDSDGRVRSETEGQQVNIEPDGKSVRLYRGRWVNAFKDGESRRLEWYEGNLTGASIDNVLAWHGIDPREFTTHCQHKPVTEIIRGSGGRIAKRAKWDGREVIVVETTPVGENEQRRYRFWIDAERKAVVRRAIEIRFQANQPWQAYTRIESHDYQQVAPGFWLPNKVKYESVEVTAELTPEKLSWSYTGSNRDWKVNQVLPPQTFELEFPEGVRVNDHRPPQTAEEKAANAPMTEQELRGLGIIAPEWEGMSRITVPKSGQPVAVEVTLKAINPQQAQVNKAHSPAPAANEALQEFLQYLQKSRRDPFGGPSLTRNDEEQIVGLSLREFHLRPGDARTFGEMTQLTRLNLQGSNVSDDDLRELATLKNLQELSLWHTNVGDAGVSAVAGMTGLKSLMLGDTKITDAVLPQIAKLTALQQLALSRTRITDAGLRSLVGLTQLMGLQLAETQIGDTGLNSLDDLPSLRGVTLDGSQVTAEGLATFAKRDGFGWMATDEGVANELARRMSAGEVAAVTAMLSFGLELPSTGEFKTRSVTAHPVTATDIERHSRRFRVEWDWNQGKKLDGLFAELAIRQGTARVIEAGIPEN